MKKIFRIAFFATVCFTSAAIAGEASGARHILFVNVAESMAQDDFEAAVARVAKSVPYPIRTGSAGALPELMSANSAKRGVETTSAKIVVYAVRDGSMPEFLSCPRHWAVANIAQLEADAPAAEVLAGRRAKTLLRGLAYAAGSGATLEQRCLLFVGGLSLSELDAAPFALSPMAHLPMLETLEELVGEDAGNDTSNGKPL